MRAVSHGHFFSVGHSQKDLDKAFCKEPQRIQSSDAITLSDVHKILKLIHNGTASVNYRKAKTTCPDFVRSSI